MPAAELDNVLPIFPVGTLVAAYEDVLPDAGDPKPIGPILDTATVAAAGSLSFDSLPHAATRYAAAAEVGGAWRFVYFNSDPPVSGDSAEEVLEALEAHIGDQTEVHGIKEPAGLEGAIEQAAFTGSPGVNVKAFGAVGDGKTDDRAAIQAAIDSVGYEFDEGFDEGSENGGTIYFPAGVYLLSGSIEVDTGHRLIGEGQASTWLKLEEGVEEDLLKTKRFDELTGTNDYASNVPPFRFGVSDMTLAADDNDCRGISFFGRRFFIERVLIIGFLGGGLRTEWRSGGIEVEAMHRDLVVRGCGGVGIDCVGPHDSSYSDCYVENHEGDYAIWVHESSGGPLFNQCHIYGDQHKVGWKLDSHAYLVNCQGEGAQECQIDIRSSETQVLGGHFFGIGNHPEDEEVDASIGIKIGDTANEDEPGRCLIHTRASRCQLCLSIEDTGGANSIIVLLEPEAEQVAYEGTINVDDHLSVLSGSSENDFHQFNRRLDLGKIETELPGWPPEGRGRLFIRENVEDALELCVAYPDERIEVLGASEGGGAVESVNGKTGIVAGLEETANKVQALAGESESEYPSEKAVQLSLAGKQPLDSDLTAIAALTTTEFGRAFLVLANAAAGRTALGLGTAAVEAAGAFQPNDADLTAIAALTTTEFGRSLLTQASAAAARGTLGAFASADVDTDTALTGNSDVKVASQKATKAYVDTLLAASDAVVYKGAIDCSASPNYPAGNAGHLYRVSVAGKIGGASGPAVEVGDTLLCNTDGAAEGNHATVGAKWNVIQANLEGAVIGPSSATDGHIVRFDGTTGRLVKGGIALTTSGTLAGNSDTNLPSEKAVKTYADAGDALAIAKTFFAAKGDILAASANDTPALLTVGSNGQIVAAASGEANGLKWVDNKTVEEHTFAIPGEITTASSEALRHFISVLSGQTVELVAMHARLGSGTSATCKLQVNGSDATGFTGLEAKSTEDGSKEPTAVALANKDRVSLVVTAVSGTPKNLSVTFWVRKSRT